MANSFSDIQTDFNRIVEGHIEKKKKSLADSHSPNTYLTELRS